MVRAILVNSEDRAEPRDDAKSSSINGAILSFKKRAPRRVAILRIARELVHQGEVAAVFIHGENNAKVGGASVGGSSVEFAVRSFKNAAVRKPRRRRSICEAVQ